MKLTNNQTSQLQTYYNQCAQHAQNSTNTTSVQNKLNQYQSKLQQPTPLTNTKNRNPKLRTALPIYNNYNQLTLPQKKYYSNKYKLQNITLINTKSYKQANYNKALQEYKHNNRVQHPRQSTLNRLKQQAHEQVTHWNIHNNYTNKYIIFINPSDYLQISDTRNTIKPRQHKDYVQSALKQLLRHPKLKLQIIDIQTGTTIKHTTHNLTNWEDINYTFNEIISELYEANKQTIYNTSQQYTSQKAQDYLYTKSQTYTDLPTQPTYKQSHIINGTYINTVQLEQQILTKQDLDTIKYYEQHHLLKTKLLTEKQQHQYKASAEYHLDLAKALYQIETKQALIHFRKYESIQSILLEDTIKQEQAISYESISYKL